MLRVGGGSLPKEQQKYLTEKQAVIDVLVSFSDRVAKGKSLWGSKNKKHFDVIRKQLSDLCSGAKRCHYCEDSAADEVEHIWPKRLYPARVFVWENYLFACGPCNGTAKGSRFPILTAENRVVEPPTGRGDPVIPPPDGRVLFIDPRSEDPMEYLELDLDTGTFLPLNEDEGSLAYLRAKWTRDVLDLNRDYLKKARISAYLFYRDSLTQYVFDLHAGKDDAELKVRRQHLQGAHHPTVWKEMIRSRHYYPNLDKLFSSAPELLVV